MEFSLSLWHSQVGKALGCSKSHVYYWLLLDPAQLPLFCIISSSLTGHRAGVVPLLHCRPRLLAYLCHWAKTALLVTGQRDTFWFLYLEVRWLLAIIGAVWVIPASSSQQNSPESASQLSPVHCDWMALPSFHLRALTVKQTRIVLVLGFGLSPLKQNGGPVHQLLFPQVYVLNQHWFTSVTNCWLCGAPQESIPLLHCCWAVPASVITYGSFFEQKLSLEFLLCSPTPQLSHFLFGSTEEMAL